MTIEVRSNDPVADKAATAPAAESEVVAESTPAPAVEQSTEVAETAEVSDPSDTEANVDLGDEVEAGIVIDSGTDPGKKKGGFQRRINKLNSRYAEKERETEYWKQQALKGAGAKVETQVEAKPAAVVEGKPSSDKFDTHAEYVEALTDWKLDQKLKDRDSKLENSRIESEQQRVARQYNERAKVFAEKTSDFKDVLEEVDDVPLSPALRDMFLSSENGPELAYELAKNRVEFERVSKLSPLAAAREIGKLEARIARPAAESKEIKTTKAPAPIVPVGGSGKGAVTKLISDPGLSQSEYESLRREQQKKRRQA